MWIRWDVGDIILLIFLILCTLFVKYVNKGNGKELTKFEVPKDHEGYIIESQTRKFTVYNEKNIVEEFNSFMETYDEFVILEAPTVIGDIRYVQICHLNADYEIQLGVVENNKIQLYSKLVDSNEALNLLKDYYHSSLKVDMSEYKLVEFENDSKKND